VYRCEVVVVNFNAGKHLGEAVEGALRSSAVTRVIVVDNASADESLANLHALPGSKLTIIRNPANLGFAVACNIGLAASTADNALLLNPDCRVSNGAIEALIDVLRQPGRIGMVGPRLLNPDGSEQAGGRRKFPMPSLVFARALGSVGLGRRVSRAGFAMHGEPVPHEPINVEAISGACMMVRREAVDDVGMLDEDYFLHCEDLDWCMRFQQKGWTIMFVPQASVVHVKGVSSRHRPFVAEFYKHRGMIRFYQKYLGERYPRWLMSLLFLSVWLRLSGVVCRRLVLGER
jgi:GT2 family glycosyltransferase